MKEKPTRKKKNQMQVKSADRKELFDENGKLKYINKKPTSHKKEKSEVVKLDFDDLMDVVKDLHLERKDFTDCHGGIRLLDGKFSVADIRPAKYGLRFYPGRDGLTHPIRLENKDDLERAAKIMRALMYGRIYKDKKLVSYKNQDFETESKRKFVEHLIEAI